jgi:hypothetical protein
VEHLPVYILTVSKTRFIPYPSLFLLLPLSFRPGSLISTKVQISNFFFRMISKFAVDPTPPSQTKFDLPPPVDEGSAPTRGVRYEPSTLRLWYYTASLGQGQPGEEELVTTTKRQRGSLPIRHYRIPSSATSPHLESIDYTPRSIHIFIGRREGSRITQHSFYSTAGG